LRTTMTSETNKAIMHRYVEDGDNAENMDVIDELFAGDFVNHDPTQPATRDLLALKQFMLARQAAFPDQRTTIEDRVVEGDKVVKRWTWRGTQMGEFHGIPATRRQVTIAGLDILRVSDGKIREIWWGYDMLGVLQQLGVIPQPELVGP
ncbi:MAG TPA: ester cyclase, partial [Herpetosiphonaceae bacterium]|nr:ester cyclase [Herpetosiphonaceae bacterium]